MTERIYESDAYCAQFCAEVTGCILKDGQYCVSLNKTAFFPEGGGQAADKGTINGLNVLDVQRQGDTIYHMLDSALPIGEKVCCEIDWELRYKRMQGHTGEHILSGVVKALFNYENVGFHMGENSILVDFNGKLTKEDIEKIETASNKAIYANADIVAYYPSGEELENLHYRSKIALNEDVRIVTIGADIDCCACCAPHLAKTGEVGIIKIIDYYPFKQGTRIEMLAGIEALQDYARLNTDNKSLMKLLAAPRDGVASAVKDKINILQTLRSEYQRVLKRLAFFELERVEIGKSVYSLTENLNFDILRYCANNLIDEGYDICLLLSKTDTNAYIYVVSSKNHDTREIAKILNSSFSGKGGGQSNFSQGSITIHSEKEIDSLINMIFE